jgi:hypothetical protein
MDRIENQTFAEPNFGGSASLYKALIRNEIEPVCGSPGQDRRSYARNQNHPLSHRFF